MCPAMGFLSARPESKSLPVSERPEEQLVQFDSGVAIHFDDAAHNNVVFGTTGSGKTSSVILPACLNLFRQGFGGLIIDVKGNLSSRVRRIANECGRAGDVVEFGTSPFAKKVTLFKVGC